MQCSGWSSALIECSVQRGVNCKCLLPPHHPRSIHREIGTHFTLEHSGTHKKILEHRLKEHIRTRENFEHANCTFWCRTTSAEEGKTNVQITVLGNTFSQHNCSKTMQWLTCNLMATRAMCAIYLWDLNGRVLQSFYERWIREREEIIFLILTAAAADQWCEVELQIQCITF